MNKGVSFFSRLADRITAVNSLLCVGLDPHKEFLDRPSGDAARGFCRRIIESCADFACAFKPNSAFFVALGSDGWAALRDVIRAVPGGIPVILDAKWGDIASSASAYAAAAFDVLGADAVTVNPYLGSDSVVPFIQDRSRGVFLLCKTSNPGADELQVQSTGAGGEPLYLQLARRASKWNAADNLGLVVGATDPGALAAVRGVAPALWLLAPGVGAQGGDLEGALRAGLRADGSGIIVPVSRAIARAKDPGEMARELRDRINRARESVRSTSPAPLRPELAHVADGLLAAGCIKFGEFKLKSGVLSPIYLDLRLLASHPALLSRVAAAYRPLLGELRFDLLAGLPYAGLPIATAIALQVRVPMIYPRKQVKSYGTQAAVEGAFRRGERAVLIDDLATTASSKFEAIEQLERAGLVVRDVAVLIDRQSGAQRALEEAGYGLHSVFTLSQLMDYWEAVGGVSSGRAGMVREFLGTS
jgi:uridine monophosphate synthetase